MLSNQQINKAKRINKKYSKELGWNRRIIETTVFGNDSNCLTEEAFINKIAEWQKHNGFALWDCDGIIGPKTYKKILKKYSRFQKEQLTFLVKKYNQEKELVSVSDTLNEYFKSYSKFTGDLSFINTLVKVNTGKSITGHSIVKISTGFRTSTKSINSMKVTVPFFKTIKKLGQAGEFAGAASLAIEWKKVEEDGGIPSSDLILKTYMFILSIIAKTKPPTPFSLAAGGVSTFYSVTEGYLEIGKKLNTASDKLANFLIQNFPRDKKPKSKAILSYPTFDERTEDRLTKKYLREY